MRQLRVPDIERGQDGGDRAAGQVDDPGDMGRYFDLDALAAFGLAADDPLGEGHRRAASQTTGATEQREKRGQIVRTHVEHRAAAALVIKLGIGMPALVASAGHVRRSADRPSDHTLSDQIETGLDSGTEKRVRSAAQKETFTFSQADELAPFGKANAQRLLDINVLAGVERGLAERVMVRRCGEVEDDLDLRIRQQIIGRQDPRHAVFLSLDAGSGGVQIGDCRDINPIEAPIQILQIDGADVAAADDSDRRTFHIGLPSACPSFAGGCPEEAAAHQLTCFRNLENIGMMAERAVEHAA